MMSFEVHLVAERVDCESFGWYLTALIGAGVGLDHTRTIWHPDGPRLLVRREAPTIEQATTDAIAALAAVGVSARRTG